jgi:uncharacterized protein YeaO (DUF488 family)
VKSSIQVKRVYGEAPSAADGCRILAERLWPRGVKKEELKADLWLRDVAPSTALRQWFGHDPEKWVEFKRRYFEELNAKPEIWADILHRAKQGKVTLLFSSKDAEHNNVVALKEYLAAKARANPTRKSSPGTRRKSSEPASGASLRDRL